jgi:signal transduction histidine kinase
MLKHDLNNTLTGVKTGLEIMAMDDAFDGTELGDELKDVVSSARRMALMIEDLGFVFADQANQQVTCEETPLREILEHLEVFTEGQGISYDVDVSDVETLAAQAAPLARSIYYGLAVFKAFSQESAQLSVRRKGGRCNVILHLKGDILEPLTASVDCVCRK